MLLKGKKALITGCNKGIGKSIFEKFIENEGEIIACVRKKSNEFEEFVNSKKKITVYLYMKLIFQIKIVLKMFQIKL